MVSVIKEEQNPLFKRKEVVLQVTQETVPSQLEAEEIVCDKYNCDSSVVRIRKIDSSFGSNCFNIIADVYDSKDEFDRVVKKTKQEVEAEKKAEEEKAAKLAEEKAAKEAAVAAEQVEEAKEEMAADETPSGEVAEAAPQAEEESKPQGEVPPEKNGEGK